MLTRLRFKNWRSLRDVEINDLTPITVFIGENSAGKTNILDALYFLRDGVADDPESQLAIRGWEEDIRTIGVDIDAAISIAISFRPSFTATDELTYRLTVENYINREEDDFESWFDEQLTDQTGKSWLEASTDPSHNYAEVWQTNGDSVRNVPNYALGLLTFGRMSAYPYVQQTFRFITERWQLLDEGFSARLNVPAGQTSDLYLLDRCADNLAVILEFMQKRHPQLYSQLTDDMRWLLHHIEDIETQKTERETRLLLKEKMHKGFEAPVVSTGTRRLMAMLAAFYALDMRYPEMPGLVVIEEPDTALNPGVLQNFVELLRNYTNGENPRQVILTTHNPRFLDYFKPEEVRVVSRDENGYTKVERIPDYIEEIWLQDHTLGEAWMTRSLGGLPE